MGLRPRPRSRVRSTLKNPDASRCAPVLNLNDLSMELYIYDPLSSHPLGAPAGIRVKLRSHYFLKLPPTSSALMGGDLRLFLLKNV